MGYILGSVEYCLIEESSRYFIKVFLCIFGWNSQKNKKSKYDFDEVCALLSSRFSEFSA